VKKRVSILVAVALLLGATAFASASSFDYEFWQSLSDEARTAAVTSAESGIVTGWTLGTLDDKDKIKKCPRFSKPVQFYVDLVDNYYEQFQDSRRLPISLVLMCFADHVKPCGVFLQPPTPAARRSRSPLKPTSEVGPATKKP